MVSLDAN